MEKQHQEDWRISDHSNTYNSALRIIKSKGFKIFLYPVEAAGDYGSYWAIKEKRNFLADDPLRLLGIITIWETFGDDWIKQQFNYDNVFDEIASKAYPDSVADIEKLSKNEFDNLVADYRIFLNRIFPKDIIPQNVTRQEFYNILDNWYKWDLEDFGEWE